jgi:hypothetical protein
MRTLEALKEVHRANMRSLIWMRVPTRRMIANCINKFEDQVAHLQEQFEEQVAFEEQLAQNKHPEPELFADYWPQTKDKFNSWLFGEGQDLITDIRIHIQEVLGLDDILEEDPYVRWRKAFPGDFPGDR